MAVDLQQEIAIYANKIVSKLEEIDSTGSITLLVPIFQDVIVKILQFSSKAYQVRKAMKDAVKKESLSLLLKNLKHSIPELSHVCQADLKSRNKSTVDQKADVLRKMVFVIKQIERLTGDFDHAGSTNASALEVADSTKLRDLRNNFALDYAIEQNSIVSTEHFGDMTSAASSSPPVDDSFSSLASNILEDSPVSSRIGIPSLIVLYKAIKSRMEKFHYDKSSQQMKYQGGKKLLSKVYQFSDMATTLHDANEEENHTSSRLKEKTMNLNELAADFVSMAIDASNGSFLYEDQEMLGKVHENVLILLNEVLEISTCNYQDETSFAMAEDVFQELIEKVRTCAYENNFIGLTESTFQFLIKAKDAGKALEQISKEKNATWQPGLIRALQEGVADVEDTLDYLISDIESKARLDSLTRKMKDILKTLVEWRLLAVKTAKDKHAVSISNMSILGKNKDEETTEKNLNEGINLAVEKSSFGTIVDQFPEAINDNDYRKVEVLANRFLGNIKIVGDLLQKISLHSSLEIKELRMRFHQYLKIAGSFCSQARKAVLASENPDFIKSLIMTGKGMEEKKQSFVSCCKKSLSPWLDIAQLTVCKRSVSVFHNLTKKIEKIIETLRATESLENSEFKAYIAKLSAIIGKTGESMFNQAEAHGTRNSTDAFLVEMSTIQWACAVICLFGIVDKIAQMRLIETAKMDNNQLKSRTIAWLSVLNELAVCWTDKEVSGEISEGIKDLEEMLQKLANEESSAKDSLELKADVIILKREFMSKMLLLNELADILTQEVREPMSVYIDPLASLSFAPNLRSFKAIQEAFFEKIDAVHTMSCLAVQDSPYKSEAHLVFVAADDLKNISEELVSTISLSGAAKKSVDFLKLRWRVKATYLIKVLMIVPEVNYSAVAGVTRHLKTASHLGRYEDLIAILKDTGSPPRSRVNKDSWKLNTEVSYRDDFYDDQITDCNSSASSILDYSLSRGTDALTASSPRQATSDLNFFRNYNTRLTEQDALPPMPLIQTPDTYNPRSSVSSTRSDSSQDTEIFVGRLARKVPPVPAKKPMPKNNQSGDHIGTSSAHATNNDYEMKNSSAIDRNGEFLEKEETKISKPIAAAARILQRELEEWEDDGNTVITVVRQMTNQMLQMADYARGEGLLRRKQDFINTAKAIAANANIVAKFAVIIADCCLDETCQLNLMHYAELVPTLSTQLKIIASVKAATPDDETADVMLIGNAENLMKSVLETLKAAESASVKMRQDPGTDEGAPLSKSATLTMQWKKKLDLRRSMESLTAPTNDLGLKIVSVSPPLALTDL
ncbi:uncharacterized protein LOC135696297 isoform X1 [Rhopilema esculentum]|uniref:uncharacterized protein LOC135696297 isoform X1 n=1 Tax=Rhopilema esculentum TaxID=499914 RepID=UPI0031D324C5